MTDIILHHYETSPYSEKVRLGLGLKGLAWASVEIPIIMPKPDLTALTGGYRKTPVLQIGADIYCDSQLIMRELERRYPSPSFYPAGRGTTAALDDDLMRGRGNQFAGDRIPSGIVRGNGYLLPRLTADGVVRVCRCANAWPGSPSHRKRFLRRHLASLTVANGGNALGPVQESQKAGERRRRSEIPFQKPDGMVGREIGEARDRTL